MMLALAACSQPSTEQPADTKQDATQAETPAATAAEAELVGAGSPFEGETVDPREFTLHLAINGSDDLVEAATQIWQTKYPNATVEKIDSAWGSGGSDARNKQLIMLSGGEQLDIGKVVWGKEFFEEGIIVDISDKVESFDYWPYLTDGQKARMSLGGKYYGATVFNNSVSLSEKHAFLNLSLIHLSFLYLYLIVRSFPDTGYPYPGFPYLDAPIPAVPSVAGTYEAFRR